MVPNGRGSAADCLSLARAVCSELLYSGLTISFPYQD
jgi:hypothetical protein